jgi:hypothetical protein
MAHVIAVSSSWAAILASGSGGLQVTVYNTEIEE